MPAHGISVPDALSVLAGAECKGIPHRVTGRVLRHAALQQLLREPRINLLRAESSSPSGCPRLLVLGVPLILQDFQIRSAPAIWLPSLRTGRVVPAV